MSIDFDQADMCKGSRCTNLLTSYYEAKEGFCDLCQCEMNEHFDKEAEEKKIKEDKCHDSDYDRLEEMAIDKEEKEEEEEEEGGQ